MAVVRRIVVILFAFAAASFAAGCVVVLAALFPEISQLDLGAGHELAVATAFLFIFISGFALLPAMIFALVTEAFAIRSVLVYALCGAATGLCAYLAFVRFDADTMSFVGYQRREIEVMTGAGVLAGLVYWLLAGRGAGRWRLRDEAPHAGPGSRS